MVESSIVYEGDLRCTATHGPSGSQIITDAPVDNHGKGEAFSPTDLVGASIGACMLTIMGIYAKQKSIDLRGAKISVQKHMSATPPRRIAKLEVEIRLPIPAAHPDVEALKQAALQCPVHRSLHPEIEKPVTFLFSE